MKAYIIKKPAKNPDVFRVLFVDAVKEKAVSVNRKIV